MKNLNNPIIERIKLCINENLESNIGLSEISRKVGISVYYMSHIFKSETGMTVVEYRTNRRMENAKTMLLQTDKSITEIAFLCGFSSQGYFSERFSKICGISPSEYRSKYKST